MHDSSPVRDNVWHVDTDAAVYVAASSGEAGVNDNRALLL